MTPTETLPISTAVIEAIRYLRQKQDVSASVLADRMTQLGYPVKRSVLANLESGRRKEVSIDHLVIAARALEVDPLSLLVRCGVTTCPACKGAPPAGFTCNTCGGAS